MHALNGIKALDISRVLAGPTAGQTLADFGADVVKIESFDGDDTRKWGMAIGDSESSYYLSANRGKRSICVDLNKPEGAALVAALADKADVFIENFKFGGVEKFGIDYSALSQRNRRLIYCSISGYGRQSPFRTRLGYDLVVQGETGIMAINGEGDEPVKMGVAAVDLVTGMISAQAILAALVARNTTGEGQYIDMSLYDCGLSLLSYVGAAALSSGKEPGRYGNNHPDIAPYGLFDCADGKVIVAVGNDAQFHKFARDVLLSTAMAEDPRFKTNRDRSKNRNALLADMGALLMGFSGEALSVRMERAGVPGGRVRSVLNALHSPEAIAREMVAHDRHSIAGDIAFLASPIKMSHTPVRAPKLAPVLGADADAVLGDWLDMTACDIARLRDGKAIA